MGSIGQTYLEDADIEKILFTEVAIKHRIAELGQTISSDYEGCQPVVIGVATGAFMFLADLVRAVSVPVEVDLIRAQSYELGSTDTSGLVQIGESLKIDIRGKDVILVEDILDTGRTLDKLVKFLESKSPKSVSICVLLDKPTRRQLAVSLSPPGKLYIGFECPNQFVVGYGLDFSEHYRSLPYIGVLKPELYKHIL